MHSDILGAGYLPKLWFFKQILIAFMMPGTVCVKTLEVLFVIIQRIWDTFHTKVPIEKSFTVLGNPHYTWSANATSNPFTQTVMG